ncbi:MAG: uracil-DNA glycosylase [Solirubrobacterales bacterium]
MAETAEARREQLAALSHESQTCTRCDLSQSRNTVVFGVGAPDADLMFIGEAPGGEEDRLGVPFIGRSGRLLSRLLEDSGISRDDVFITSTLKCRPPGNRDPKSTETESCRPWLFEQIRLVEPRVVATLGNFATRLLSGNPAGITSVHGKVQVHTLGTRTVFLYPLFHPAAALRSTGTSELLRKDIEALPDLLTTELPGTQGVGGP